MYSRQQTVWSGDCCCCCFLLLLFYVFFLCVCVFVVVVVFFSFLVLKRTVLRLNLQNVDDPFSVFFSTENRQKRYQETMRFQTDRKSTHLYDFYHHFHYYATFLFKTPLSTLQYASVNHTLYGKCVMLPQLN